MHATFGQTQHYHHSYKKDQRQFSMYLLFNKRLVDGFHLFLDFRSSSLLSHLLSTTAGQAASPQGMYTVNIGSQHQNKFLEGWSISGYLAQEI